MLAAAGLALYGATYYYVFHRDENRKIAIKLCKRCNLRPENIIKFQHLIVVSKTADENIKGNYYAILLYDILSDLGFNLQEIIKYPNEEFDACLEDMIQTCITKYKVVKAD